MAIIDTIHSASYAWERARRFQCFENWTSRQFEVLFEHFEALSDDIGENIEFDPVAWACDFSAYDSAVEAAEDRLSNYEPDPDHDEDEAEEAALEALQDEGLSVLAVDGGGVLVGP